MHKTFNFDFIGKRKLFFTISIVLVAFSILSTFIFGVDLDIQFKGGTIITYVYDGDLDCDSFVNDAKEILGGAGVKYTTGVDFSTGKSNIQLSLTSTSGLSSTSSSSLQMLSLKSTQQTTSTLLNLRTFHRLPDVNSSSSVSLP